MRARAMAGSRAERCNLNAPVSKLPGTTKVPLGFFLNLQQAGVQSRPLSMGLRADPKLVGNVLAAELTPSTFYKQAAGGRWAINHQAMKLQAVPYQTMRQVTAIAPFATYFVS
jgi:hypothetical protein